MKQFKHITLFVFLLLSNNFAQADAARCEGILENRVARVDIEALFQANADGKKQIEIENFLANVEKSLLNEFEGWDDAIRNFMGSMRAMYLAPESVGKPIVVPLMSFPGYGKTTLIQRIIELMGWGPDIVQNDVVKPGMTYLPYKEIIKKGHRIGSLRDHSRPVDWVLVIDEVQKLTSDDSLREQYEWYQKAENLNKLKPQDYMSSVQVQYAVQGVAEAQIAKETWWQILGNGRLTVKPKKTVGDIFIELQQLRAHMITYKTGIDSRAAEIQKIHNNASNENQRALTPAEVATVSKLETEISQIRDNSSVHLAGFMKILDVILEEHTHLLSGDSSAPESSFEGRSMQDMLKLFEEDPDRVYRVLKGNVQIVAPPLEKDFRRGVLFLAGNPEVAIKRIEDQLAGTEVSPDNLHRVAKEQPFVLVEKWFRSVFGSEPAMASRLNLSRWRLIAPFSGQQWLSMIRRKLNVFKEKLEEGIVNYGVRDKFEIQFDKSLEDLLMNYAVDALQGPRIFMETSAQILTGFVVQLPGKIREFVIAEATRVSTDAQYADAVPKTKRKLVVKFISETSQIIVTEDVPERKSDDISILRGRHEDTNTRAILERRRLKRHDPFYAQFDVGLPFRDRSGRVSSVQNSITKSKNALYQSARAIVGAVHFESMPREIDSTMVLASEALENMWGSPDAPHLHYLLGSAKMHLAGFIAEQKLMSNTMVSDYSKLDIVSLQSILLSMKEDLIKRQALSGFLLSARQNQPMDVEKFLPSDPYARMVYSKLKEDKTFEIFEAIYADVLNTINRHEVLIKATASYLTEKSPVMGPDEIRAAIQRYYNVAISYKIWDFRKNLLRRQLLVSAQPGTLPSNYTFVSGNYQYTLRGNTWYMRILKAIGLNWW